MVLQSDGIRRITFSSYGGFSYGFLAYLVCLIYNFCLYLLEATLNITSISPKSIFIRLFAELNGNPVKRLNDLRMLLSTFYRCFGDALSIREIANLYCGSINILYKFLRSLVEQFLLTAVI